MTADAQRRRRIDSFLVLAEEEFVAAGILLDKLPRQAAYFQQQCVEKLLRAAPEAAGVPVGPTHNRAPSQVRRAKRRPGKRVSIA